MALFNKLFSARKKIVKCQDAGCAKLFSFTSDQVRVAVFRECDFRGRKLLFDSHSVQKILLAPGDEQARKKYTEIKNDHGYMYTKPNSDVGQLGEMIFGSVAMSYRGTTYKIHKTMTKLVCSEVFPSPRNPTRLRSSAPSHMQVHASTNSSLEQSVQLEDSGASSGTCSDQSVNSTASDTLLVCKRVRSVPLDVPVAGSLVSSSGFGEQSGSSIASGPQSIPIDLTNQGNSTAFSANSLKKSWLRHAHASPDLSTHSIASDDSLPRSRGKSTKIGLAVVIEITNENDLLEEILMEHAALLDSLLWRVRTGVENAYVRPNNFVSLMFDLAAETAKWFVDLLTGSQLAHCVWQELSSSSSSLCCDNLFSIKRSDSFSDERTSPGIKKCFRSELLIGEDYSFLNLSKFLRGDNGKKGEIGVAETFVKELCELLETVDTKNTNFFISTLLTAVLTHHLGWVSTVLSPDSDEPCANPLWTQLTDLYGAVGHPTKMSHTIIMGNNSKTELVTKILDILTYFIRSTNVNKKNLTRVDVESENRSVEVICKLNSCIPKENYKKYEDHLREMISDEKIIKGGLGMKKTKTCSNLNVLSKQEFVKGGEIFDKVTSLGLQAISPAVDTEKFDFKAFTLSDEQQKLNDINEAKQQIGRFFSPKKNLSDFDIKPEDLENKNVVFVLGDNDTLVGLKHSKSFDFSSKRPNELNLNIGGKFFVDSDSSTEEESQKSFLFNDNDFHEYKNPQTPIKPSTSYSLLNSPKKFNLGRAQSEPPEPPNLAKPQTPKYRYSGVKFNFQQYPQIVENYMKGKNIELTNLQNFSEKDFNFPKFNLTEPLRTASNGTELKGNANFLENFTYFEEGLEPLQTPSNASELEFTSDLLCGKFEKAKEKIETVNKKEFVRVVRKDTVVKEPFKEQNGVKDLQSDVTKLKVVEFPMPKSVELARTAPNFNLNSSLMRGCADHYVSDMVLQGTSAPKSQWESTLKRDLVSSTRHSLLNKPVEEAIAIVANTDTWEVHVMSSHTYVIDRRSSGVIVGMSQLVANMLESLLHLWRLHTPAEYCLMHIEQRLQEFCVRSKAMAQLLLETDCCSMDLLTSSLKLEVNDVPLLMAIASTHSPQVTQKYGICIQ